VCKQITHPRSSEGGITHILVTTPTVDTRIDNKKEVETTLHRRNIKHFSQAANTPCASGMLSELLEQNGVSKFTNDALEGKMMTYQDEMTQTIFEALKQKRQTMSDHMPFEDMVMGFTKWKERTTTSPSGKHLGIYKTLTKAHRGVYERGRESNNQQQDEEKETETKTIATRILHIQHKIMNLAIKHCHTLERWKIINNMFLEKIQGKPRIEKLRVIHIYEADWNLILKYFVAYKLHGRACREHTVQEEQTGGRPGKCAAYSATTAAITSDIVCLQKLTGATLYNDAAACFDRIIENISNATLMSEGLNQSIAKLHAQTLAKATYHIKTSHGVAEDTNGHMRPEPFLWHWTGGRRQHAKMGNTERPDHMLIQATGKNRQNS
jgi:hypothetical protein